MSSAGRARFEWRAAGSGQEVARRGKRLIGAALEEPVGDEVARGGILVAAEGGLKIGIVGEVLRRIEVIAVPAFSQSIVDEMHAAGVGLGAESEDQVGMEAM